MRASDETLGKLRGLRRAAARAAWEATRADMAYNLAIAEAHADLAVPPDHAVDVFGDGTVKPVADLAPFRPEE